jgi:hypothetical protein
MYKFLFVVVLVFCQHVDAAVATATEFDQAMLDSVLSQPFEERVKAEQALKREINLVDLAFRMNQSAETIAEAIESSMRRVEKELPKTFSRSIKGYCLRSDGVYGERIFRWWVTSSFDVMNALLNGKCKHAELQPVILATKNDKDEAYGLQITLLKQGIAYSAADLTLKEFADAAFAYRAYKARL